MIEDLVRAADDETKRGFMSDARRPSVLLSQQQHTLL